VDFDQLRYFVSVAQTLNFTQAARLHYITQPAISRRITDLEKEMGTRLFLRNSHQVALTRAGEEFFQYALSVLDMTTVTQQRLHNIAAGKEGHLRISAVPTSEHVLYKILSAFSHRYPAVQLDLNICTGVAQIASINKGEHDFYFSFEKLLQASERLDYLVTDLDRFHLFVPAEYAHGVDVHDFTSLGGLPLVTESRAEGPFLVEQVFSLCASRGFDTTHTLSCSDIRSVAVLTNAGMGFTLFPKAVGRSICTDHVISFSLPGDDALTTNAVGWDPNNRNDTAQVFLDLLREYYSGVEPGENSL
jgi:DNA-binding transcriptional LysR family regulator